jgi:ribosomal protein L17
MAIDILQNIAVFLPYIFAINEQNAVKKLMEQLGPRYLERKGGYTRTTTIRNRVGDGAEEVQIEFV